MARGGPPGGMQRNLKFRFSPDRRGTHSEIFFLFEKSIFQRGIQNTSKHQQFFQFASCPIGGVMTKSKGIGRGGIRPGAGRKKSTRTISSVQPALATAEDVSWLAGRHSAASTRRLIEIASSGPTALVRIAAADAIVDWAHRRGATLGSEKGKANARH